MFFKALFLAIAFAEDEANCGGKKCADTETCKLIMSDEPETKKNDATATQDKPNTEGSRRLEEDVDDKGDKGDDPKKCDDEETACKAKTKQNECVGSCTWKDDACMLDRKTKCECKK